MARYLVLDFETNDPYISLGLGAGWVYGIKVPYSAFNTLGYSYLVAEDDKVVEFDYVDLTTRKCDSSTALLKLSSLLKEVDFVLMHNAQYDLGCLRFLNYDIDPIPVLDTKILAFLYDNTLTSYSLDNLCKQYGLTPKNHNALIQVVEKFNLGPLDLKTEKQREAKKQTKTYLDVILRYAKTNMSAIQECDFSAMAAYSIQDVKSTFELYIYLITKMEQFYGEETNLGQGLAIEYSSAQKSCVKIRERGIRVDLDVVRKGMQEMEPELAALRQKIYDHFGQEVNLESPSQLRKLLGSSSTDKKELKKRNDVIGDLLLQYREISKIYRDFFESVLDMQIWTCPEALDARYGRVYPELNIFGARTGRFSSSSPNIQQIPKRSTRFGQLTRSMFVPEDGEQWYSLDWSNQEGRLQIHYAGSVIGSQVENLINKFKIDPEFDMHQEVANMAHITRAQAKTINLGLSYGMGQAKLCRELGLPTEKITTKRGIEIDVAGPEGKEILAKYYKICPYLKTLTELCRTKLVSRGYIQTINKRKLRRELGQGSPIADYKALNMLIQGSAADQCIKALVQATLMKNLPIVCVIHDEFNLSGTFEDALAMKHIMETTLELRIPMIAEIKTGSSWGDLYRTTIAHPTISQADRRLYDR